MKFFKLIIVFLLLSVFSYGQEFDLNRETIKRNKVRKCFEYDYKDSINYFKEYKNGIYTIFDINGRKIEQNAYLGGILSEFKVIYMYDNTGRELMFTWYQEDAIPKITRVYIYKYDDAGNKIGYCDYSPNDNPPKWDTLYGEAVVVDTIIKTTRSIKQQLIISFYNKERTDTARKCFNYYKNEKLDSSILIGYQEKKMSEKLTTKYLYLDEILAKSEFVRYDFRDEKITETNTTRYLKNGLLERVDSKRYYFPNKRSIPKIDSTNTKFIYSYWK